MDISTHVLVVSLFLCLSVHLSVCQPPATGVGNQWSRDNQLPTGTEVCTSPCPPNWVTQLDFYRSQGIVSLAGNQPVCRFARDNGLISACNSTHTGCSNHPTTPFHCCPVSCLTALEACYMGPRTTHLCLPADLEPWLQQLMTIFMAG